MRKTLQNIIFIIFAVVVIFVAGYNALIVKNKEFWTFSFTSCATMLITLIVTYYFTKINQDEINKKEAYIRILNKMQEIVCDKALYMINTETDINVVLMKKRDLSNYFNLIKNYGKKFQLENEIKCIEPLVQEYTEFLGENTSNLENLKNNSNALKRPLSIIDNKISEMIIKMYE